MATASPCPSCASPVFPDDFMCGNCDLILNPRAASGEYKVKEPTIVRALLSITGNPPSGEAPAERPAYPKTDRETTLKIAAPMDMQTFPRVIADLDIALAPLHAFEAYVISFLNGSQPVPEIAKAAKIKQVEIEAVLRSLLERKLVELEHRLPEAEGPPNAAPAQESLAGGSPGSAAAGAQAPAPGVSKDSDAAHGPASVDSAPGDGAAPAAAPRESAAAPAQAPVAGGTLESAAAPAPAAPQAGPVRRRPARSTVVTAPSTPPPPSAASPAGRPPPPVLSPGTAAKPPSPDDAARIAPVMVSPSLRSERWPRAGSRPAAEVPRQPTPATAPEAAAPVAPVLLPSSGRSERWPRAGSRPVAEVPKQPAPAPAPAPAAPAPPEPEPVPHAALAPALQVIPVRHAVAPPVERAESVLQKAIALERAGDVDGAVHVLERAIARFKKPGPLYNKLAVIVLGQRHDYARAEELLKKALEHEPDNAVYQQNLFKVVGLAASSEKKEQGGGFFARLRRGR